MDVYIHDVRMQLKLAVASLNRRLTYLEDRPKGIIMRRNQITHTRVLLSLVTEAKALADHDPEEWYEEGEELPF